jgi:hypothetical protein
LTIESTGAGGTDKLRFMVNANPNYGNESASLNRQRYAFKTEVEATHIGADGSHSAKVKME